MTDFDLHRWFSDDELEVCPSCAERAGIRLPRSGSFLCLACGAAEMRPDERAADEPADA